MGRPRPTNNGGHTSNLRPPLLAAIFVILLGLIATLDAHCNDHHPNMAAHKQSDAAAAVAANSKTIAKFSKPKARTRKAAQETGQRSLCPRWNSGSPMENDTNLHITTINLNRDRFSNVLTVLGGTSPGKNITPPESPTDPLDELVDLLPPLMQAYDEPANDEPQERGSLTVRINKPPTSASSVASPQPEHERAIPQPEEEVQPGLSRKPILRNSEMTQPTQQEERQSWAATNEQGDGVIHNKTNKLLKEVRSGNEAYSFYVEDFAGLFPVWLIIELAMSPTGQTKDERMTQFVKCITSLFGEILIVDKQAAIAPIVISNNLQEHMITDKATIPTNFTKLGKWVMLSGRSWVFKKKDKGSNNVYARFRLKSTVPAEDMVTRISFEFSRMGSSKI
jgi:hypothetical protein